mmetsp:Transcript_12869/g.22726  ORF Transcript_12869/g.22726 Transcript_12869/m.22726 type:complete len:206 (-) Transcript_12869:260-877(-)
MDTLKLSARFEYHTTRTLEMKKVPRFPCSLLRFHTPLTRLYVCSRGSSFSSRSWMKAPLSLRSRYRRLLSYALNTACTMLSSWLVLFVRLVNTNSKRWEWYLVCRYSAWVSPLRREEAALVVMEVTHENPMEMFVRLLFLETHNRRRLVMCSEPCSPLLPLVSSTGSRISSRTSPLMHRCSVFDVSNLISLSCHISVILLPPNSS